MTKGEQTQQRMVEAVIESVARYGFEFTTATTVSKLGKVNRGLIVHYFSTMEKLLKAGSDQVFDFTARRTTELMLQMTEVEDPVEKYFRATFGWMKEKASYGQFLISLISRASYDKKSQAPVKAVLTNGRDRLKSILDDGVKSGRYRCKNTREAALILHGALVGNIISYYTDPSTHETSLQTAIRTAELVHGKR
jgi:AcrR family transcriptional regulator